MAIATMFTELNGVLQIYFFCLNYNVFPLERDWD